MRAVVCCPGTCGELFQGWPGGLCQLISCPIDLWTRIEIILTPGEGRILLPPLMEKTEKALLSAIDLWKLRGLDISLSRSSQLPGGRGYASSTADILAALYGLALCVGRRLLPQEATELAVSVEPSDGLAWENLVLMDHRRFSRWQEVGPVPEFPVLLFDPGGEVDTISFNGKAVSSGGVDYDGILYKLKRGIVLGNWRMIGQSATESALASQTNLPKNGMETLIDSALSLGAIGVVTAHSGTISGVLFRPGGLPEWKGTLWPTDMGTPRMTRLIPGGVRIMEVEYD